MGDETWERSTALFALLSLSSSVGIVLVNKMVLTVFHFSYPFTLTCLHFFVGSCSLWVSAALGGISVKQFPQYKVGIAAFAGTIAIASQAASLQFNSVAVFQTFKLCAIPFSALVYSALGRQTSGKVWFSICIILCGSIFVIFAGGTVSTSSFGLAVGAFSVASVVFEQVYCGELLRKYDLSAPELMLFIMPIRCVFTIAFVVKFELKVQEFSMSHLCAASIFLSCIFALGVNIATGAVIKNTSATTYQILGIFKSALTTGISWFIFHVDTMKILQEGAGFFVALVGVFLYGHYKRSEHKQTHAFVEMKVGSLDSTKKSKILESQVAYEQCDNTEESDT